MKYFCLWNVDWEDTEKVREAWKQVLDERVKGSDKFPEKLLFEPHLFNVPGLFGTKNNQGFFIFETDNEEHLINFRMHYAPYLDFRFIPITSISKSFETWMGMER